MTRETLKILEVGDSRSTDEKGDTLIPPHLTSSPTRVLTRRIMSVV